MTRSIQRYLLTNDDDGHWYCIPCDLYPTFEDMLIHGADDEWCEFCILFDEYRINGGPTRVTFENPKNE